jgi:hypothetical protein
MAAAGRPAAQFHVPYHDDSQVGNHHVQFESAAPLRCFSPDVPQGLRGTDFDSDVQLLTRQFAGLEAVS